MSGLCEISMLGGNIETQLPQMIQFLRIYCPLLMALLCASGYVVQETKKENGLPYPASTLRSLLAALQRTIQVNKIPFNIFDKADMHFLDLHNTLDTLRKDGIGAEVKHAGVISLEHEVLMWQNGVLGVQSPDSLLRAAFYMVGLHFCLGTPRLKAVSVYSYSLGWLLQFNILENGSKNYQGRFSETGQANKIGRAYAQPDSGERCPVRILDLYLSKLPPGSTAFYMQPLQKLTTDPSLAWYKNMAVGVNPLKNMMTNVSQLAGLDVKYTA